MNRAVNSVQLKTKQSGLFPFPGAMLGSSGSSISTDECFPNVIFVNGVISDQCGIEFYKQYHKLDLDKPVIIIINSDGGDLHSAFTIVDTMRMIRESTLLVTACVGNAYSAGALILSAGSKGARFMAPNSSAMVHVTQLYSTGGNFMTEVMPQIKSVENMTTQMINMLSEEITKTLRETISKRNLDRNKKRLIERFQAGDHYLTPEQAIQFGIADQVGILELDYIVPEKDEVDFECEEGATCESKPKSKSKNEKLNNIENKLQRGKHNAKRTV